MPDRRRYSQAEKNILGGALVNYIQAMRSDFDEDHGEAIALAEKLLQEVRDS